jgi:flavin prenyltransferase
MNRDSARGYPVVLAVTGASGAVYAARTLQWLLMEQQRVHLVVSSDGLTVIRQELGFQGNLDSASVLEFLSTAQRFIDSGGAGQSAGKTDLQSGSASAPSGSASAPSGSASVPSDSWLELVSMALQAGHLQIHQSNDYFTPIASGSYRTSAMVICPCSGTTLAAITHANGRNLIHRAAEVHLKERRKLILVPRETPLSIMQIENMLKVSQAGAIVLPASPGWYNGVSGLKDLVDFVAARILDQLDIPHERMRRWS